MAKKKHKRNDTMGTSSFKEIPIDHGVLEEYIQYGPQYDTINDRPVLAGETEIVRQVPYKKLSADTRKLLQLTMADLVADYWQSKRQIPCGKDAKELREAATLEVYRQTGQYAKDSDELKHNLNECIISAINRLLRKEQ